ncbi:MAG: hypothetical protein Q7L07_17365 [Pseudohongiella sp.]|nr:hypothetical protein [Pseudohongiella sp.]
MKEIKQTLSTFELNESDLREHLINGGGTPDIVLAGLLRVFDDYEDIEMCHWLYDFAEEAIDRVFSLVAEASNEDPVSVKKLLYRAAAYRAQAMQQELFDDFEGENPFECDCPDAEVTQESPWRWPVISDQAGSKPMEGDFAPFSALKMFGYTVGKTQGWDKKRREAFLTDFMEQKLPKEVATTFGNEYGEPMSTTRLRKVANVIANNCGLRIKSDKVKYAHAIADWKSDLQFLKVNYYEKKGLKFMPWPVP